MSETPLTELSVFKIWFVGKHSFEKGIALPRKQMPDGVALKILSNRKRDRWMFTRCVDEFLYSERFMSYVTSNFALHGPQHIGWFIENRELAKESHYRRKRFFLDRFSFLERELKELLDRAPFDYWIENPDQLETGMLMKRISPETIGWLQASYNITARISSSFMWRAREPLINTYSSVLGYERGGEAINQRLFEAFEGKLPSPKYALREGDLSSLM